MLQQVFGNKVKGTKADLKKQVIFEMSANEYN